MPDSCRCSGEGELARPLKRRTVVCCATTRGQQLTTTVNWELELSNARFIHGIGVKAV